MVEARETTPADCVSAPTSVDAPVTPNVEETVTAPVVWNVATWKLPVPVAFVKVNPWKLLAPFDTVSVLETVRYPEV